MTLEWTPLEAPGIQDEAEAASWARLRIVLVDESGRTWCPTFHLDKDAKSSGDATYGPVVALAEWIALAWPHIFESRRGRPTVDDKGYLWDRVHVASYAGDGIAVPRVSFSAADAGGIRVRWAADPEGVDRPERIRFLSRGEVVLATEELDRALREFVDSVCGRLTRQAPGSARTSQLVEDWLVATGKPGREHQQVVTAARMGILWCDAGDEERRRVDEAIRQLGNPMFDAALDAWTPPTAEAYGRFSHDFWTACRRARGSLDPWRDAVARLQAAGAGQPLDVSRPWETGWEAASRYRASLGLDPDQPSPRRSELDAIAGSTSATPPSTIDSALAWARGHRPVFAMRADLPRAARRFASYRSLYSALFEADLDADRAFAHSRFVVGRHSVANAFAAELLAPAAYLRAHVDAEAVDEDTIHGLARALDAPFRCVRHQIENQGIAKIPTWSA